MAVIEYYVDPSLTSDTGNGQIGTPWGRASTSVVQYALDQITRNNTVGDRINIKSGGSDTVTAKLDFSTYITLTSPSLTAPLVLQGYAVAAGDNPTIQPIITANAGAFGIIDEATLDYVHLTDIHFTNSTGTALIIADEQWSITNCEIDNCTGNGLYLKGACRATGNHIHNIGGAAIDGYGIFAFRNFIEDVGVNSMNYGIYITANSSDIIENIISMKSGTGDGINYEYGCSVIGNSVFADGSTGEGIRNRGGTQYTKHLINNLVEGFGTGIQATFVSELYAGNSVYNCSVADFSISGLVLIDVGNNESLSASPFVDAINGDFTPVDVGLVKGNTYPLIIGQNK